MAKKITLTKKVVGRGDDGHKIISVRMRDELIEQLDALAQQTNRSRNEVINLLLASAVSIVSIEEDS